MSASASCPFCTLSDDRLAAQNQLAVAFRDGYPVSPGHTLIIPRRHIGDWWQATSEERVAIFALVDECKATLDAEHQPHGYNIGINCGSAAGQTIDHLHVHLIPRFADDVDDPTGGVRFVIPQKGNYRRPGHIPSLQPQQRRRRLATGGKSDPFADHVRPEFATATEIDILAAFVQNSGIDLLDPWLVSALERGCGIRVLTGDYLNITQADALRRLCDLEHGENLQEGEESARGTLHMRVVEIAQIRKLASTFHPKSWIFRQQDGGVAFVGSSNVSRAALQSGVEWNLRVDEATDAHAFREIGDAFTSLWSLGRVIDNAWLRDYCARAREADMPLPQGESVSEPVLVPSPRDLQRDALADLANARQEGRDRAMVVMATGLGKTWLAAFDIEQFQRSAQSGRVLFLAHRIEILRQAARTLRALFREATFSWYVGGESDASGDFVLGSIAKISRAANLAKLSSGAFDYIVVDEVHHATAASYRRIMTHFQPAFWLGLTATPERADAGDVFALFDECVAFRADIGAGVALGELVPFHYFGLADSIDYKPIPWRNQSFVPSALEDAVLAEARMTALLDALDEHPGERTLLFCCSIRHATYVSKFLSANGRATVAVHSGPGTADREQALRDLSSGTIEAIVTVDLFNEGVDIPLVDRVVMLRPTESPVVFLQQLGRGLRIAPGKTALTVIDFIGNHKVFLNRVRTLLTMLPGDGHSLAGLMRTPQILAEGCTVNIELVAIDLLKSLLPAGDLPVFVRRYRELRASRDQRPQVAEMHRLGYNPAAVRGWFEFVDGEGDLSQAESAVMPLANAWLVGLERTKMTKSFKMVCLEVLLDHDALFTGMSEERLAALSYSYILRAPGLLRDITGLREFPDSRGVERGNWLQYWRKNPIKFWTPWFDVQDGVFRFAPGKAPAGDQETVAAMTRELVTYRMARYRRRVDERTQGSGSFTCRVIQTSGTPIIKLPDRKRADVPSGETNCRLPDGSIWRFRFVKHFVNVARPVGANVNRLAELMQSWFGADVGLRGTDYRVEFTHGKAGWSVEPAEHGQLMPDSSLPLIAAIAAGFSPRQEIGGVQVAVPSEFVNDRRFVIRVDGDSMEPTLLRGDLVICESDRLPDGQHDVVIMNDTTRLDEGETALKRMVSEEKSWIFASDNPAFPCRIISRADSEKAPISGVLIYNLTKSSHVR